MLFSLPSRLARAASSSTWRRHWLGACFALASSALPLAAHAQEAVIAENLPKLLPNLPPIDEITPTAVNGLYEVRVNGAELFYTDAKGQYILQGDLIDLRNKVNLTEAKTNKLSAIPFASLPVADGFTIVRGNGKRKLVVFEDPNCGYCKRFERDLAKIDNITVHVMLYPILGADSVAKSKAIWCSKSPSKAFLDWMLKDIPPSAKTDGCNTQAIDRTVTFGKQKKITGTPTMFFEDGSRAPGALPADEIEKRLKAATPN